MNATVNDHSVHAPAGALLSETDGQEEQEGEAEEHSSGAVQASVLKLRGRGF